MKTAHKIAWDKTFDGITPLRRQLLEKEIEQAIMDEREACATQVRHDCSACEGSGHADAETECEYCGRPMAAIRART